MSDWWNEVKEDVGGWLQYIIMIVCICAAVAAFYGLNWFIGWLGKQ